jgi:hypothetical protein
MRHSNSNHFPDGTQQTFLSYLIDMAEMEARQTKKAA